MSFIYTPQTTSAPYTGAMKTDLTKYDATVTTSTAVATADSNYQTPISIALTTTTELLIFWGASAIHAVVWDNFNRVFGTAVLVRTNAGLSTYDVAAALISTLGTSSSVLICSLPSSTGTDLETVVLSVSNTTITVNTAVATTLANPSQFIQTPTVANGPQRLIAIGSSFVLCYWTTAIGNTSLYTAITVSGTTPTLGTELAVTNLNQGSYTQQTYVYSSSVLVTVTSSTLTLWATPITVSGTTLTVGTAANTTVTGSYLISAQFSDNRIALAYPNTTAFSGVVSVSGTTATISTANTGMSLGGGTMLATMQIFGLKALIVLNVSTLSNRANLLTNTAGTASAGTSIVNPFGASQDWYLAGTDGTNAYLQAFNSTNEYFLTITTSGSSPVINAVFPANTDSQLSGVTASFNLYSTRYGNFENSGLLKTSANKVAPLSTNTSFLTYSFDGTSLSLEQQAVGFVSSKANKSPLSSAAGWVSYYSAANTTTNKKVYFRRIELA